MKIHSYLLLGGLFKKMVDTKVLNCLCVFGLWLVVLYLYNFGVLVMVPGKEVIWMAFRTIYKKNLQITI